jgi:hypothetical protein
VTFSRYFMDFDVIVDVSTRNDIVNLHSLIMARLLKTLVVLVIVVCLSKQASFAPRKKKDPFECGKACRKVYHNIDTLLSNYVQSNNITDSMLLISAWIEVAAQTLQPNESTPDQSKGLNSQDQADVVSKTGGERETNPPGIMDLFADEGREQDVLKALMNIRDLSLIDGLGKCKLSTAKVLQTNDQALDGAISKLPPGKAPKTYIEKILKHYLDLYLKSCHFRERLKDFDPESLETMKKIIGALIGANADANLFAPKVHNIQKFVESQPIDASFFADKHMNSIGSGKMDGKVVKEILEQKQVSKDLKWDDKSSVRKVLQKYLFDPCAEYVSSLESSFGNKWTLAESIKYHEMMGSKDELYKHLAYYHGCQKVQRNKFALVLAVKRQDNEKMRKNQQKTDWTDFVKKVVK